MIKKIITTKEVIKSEKYCDECGDLIDKGSYCRNTKCNICGKDLCEKCIGHEEFAGDYSIEYCEKCWSFGEPYRKKIDNLEDEIEKLSDEWYKLCKK